MLDVVEVMADKYPPGVALAVVVGLREVILADLATDLDALTAIRAMGASVAMQAGVANPFPDLAEGARAYLDAIGTPTIPTPEA
jgi:hypothetical protein